MTYICIDTSDNITSLTLAENGEPIRFLSYEGPYHVERVASLAAEIVSASGIQMKDLDFISVVVGPGGFSGLRVGVTFASVLATALSLPVVELSALELRALSVQERWDYLIVVEDGKRKEVFFGIFRADGVRPVLVSEGHDKPENLNVLVSTQLSDLLDSSKVVVVTGGGLNKYRDIFAFGPAFHLNEDVRLGQSAKTLAYLSYVEFCEGRIKDPKNVTIKYLRDADARANYVMMREPKAGSVVEA